MTNTDKIVVLLRTEDGKLPTDIKDITRTTIDPLELLDDRVHDLNKLYEDAYCYDNEYAKELLEYIVFEQNSTSPLVFKVTSEIASIKKPIAFINASLLSDNDLEFINSIYNNIVYLTTVPTETGDVFLMGRVGDTMEDVRVTNDPKEVARVLNEIIKEVFIDG